VCRSMAHHSARIESVIPAARRVRCGEHPPAENIVLWRRICLSKPAEAQPAAHHPCTTSTCHPAAYRRQLEASAGGTQGIGRLRNQFHYYRLTMDNRIVLAATTPSTLGPQGRRPYRTGRPPYRRWPHTSSITFPPPTSPGYHRWRAPSTPHPFLCDWDWHVTAGRLATVHRTGVVRRRFPPTCAWISSTASQRPRTELRWSVADRCRFRRKPLPHRYPRRPVVAGSGMTTRRQRTSCWRTLDALARVRFLTRYDSKCPRTPRSVAQPDQAKGPRHDRQVMKGESSNAAIAEFTQWCVHVDVAG